MARMVESVKCAFDACAVLRLGLQMTENFWVGKLNDSLYVFDRDVQLNDCPHVFLWNVALDTMQKFVPTQARTQFHSVRESETTSPAINSYLRWKSIHASAWLAEERRYYQDRRANEQSRKENAKLYTTHCFECQRELISDEDHCPRCGWIKCACGACGCKYVGDR